MKKTDEKKGRDKLNQEANKIREKLTMQGAGEILDELLKYSDKQILKAKTKRLKIKVTII